MPKYPTAALACGVLVFALSLGSGSLPSHSQDWIRRVGESIELRVRGTVLLADETPADEFDINADLAGGGDRVDLPVTVSEGQFEFWLPMHRTDWYALKIDAVSRDKTQRGTLSLSGNRLRQAAIDGLELTLQPSTRTVTLKVVHEGVPVANAHVNLETKESAIIEGMTANDGTLEINLLPDDRLRALTAWTEDHRFGGFQFDRGPVRDPVADSHTIELSNCRDQVIRVVNGSGHPQPGVKMHLHVATPQPHINYLGSLSESTMVSDENGEAVFCWFPDWKEVHAYVDLWDDAWVKDGKVRWSDGVFLVTVKPKAERKRVHGVLKGVEGSLSGFQVQWTSFEGEVEGHSDQLRSTTDSDGKFSAEVLPGATYCLFVNDAEFVSEMVDLIPAPGNGKPNATVELKLKKAVPVEIEFTAGDRNRPIANQTLYVRQIHRYQWLVDGEMKHGASARDSHAKTNREGKTTVMAEAGKEIEVSIYNPDWRTTETIDVVQGQKNLVQLHRDFDEPRTILGVVVKGPDQEFDFENVQVVAGGIDRETQGTETAAVRENGVFSFQTVATAVGVVAVTEDGTAGGLLTVDNPTRLIRLQMQPTMRFRGQLVDAESKPIEGREVLAIVHVGSLEIAPPFHRGPPAFEWKRFTVTTDASGFYTIEALPAGVMLSLSTVETTVSKRTFLRSSRITEEEKPVIVSVIKD